MFRKWLEKLRGSSREPDDLALGTKRPATSWSRRARSSCSRTRTTRTRREAVFRKLLKRFRLKSVQAGDGQRSVDNIDAMTSTAQTRMTPRAVPPRSRPTT